MVSIYYHQATPRPLKRALLVLRSPVSLYRWLAANLELLGNGLVFVAATCAVLSKAHLSAGLAGFSVSAALQVLQRLPLAGSGSDQRGTDPCWSSSKDS